MASEVAITEAARGELYSRASSPKDCPFEYSITFSRFPSLSMKQSKVPAKVT